jgi:hypothetical protein
MAGADTGDFSITGPSSDWPVGKYRLDIYIGDKLASCGSSELMTNRFHSGSGRDKSYALDIEGIGPKNRDVRRNVQNLIPDLHCTF